MTAVFLPHQPEAQPVQQALLQPCKSGHLPERTGSENLLQPVAVSQHLQGLGNMLHPALFASQTFNLSGVVQQLIQQQQRHYMLHAAQRHLACQYLLQP